MISDRFLYVEPHGSAREFEVRVGSATRASEDEWSVAVDVGDGKSRLIHGVSALQAHALALRFLESHLRHLAEQGQLLYPNERTEVDLEATFGRR